MARWCPCRSGATGSSVVPRARRDQPCEGHQRAEGGRGPGGGEPGPAGTEHDQATDQRSGRGGCERHREVERVLVEGAELGCEEQPRRRQSRHPQRTARDEVRDVRCQCPAQAGDRPTHNQDEDRPGGAPPRLPRLALDRPADGQVDPGDPCDHDAPTDSSLVEEDGDRADDRKHGAEASERRGQRAAHRPRDADRDGHDLNAAQSRCGVVDVRCRRHPRRSDCGPDDVDQRDEGECHHQSTEARSRASVEDHSTRKCEGRPPEQEHHRRRVLVQVAGAGHHAGAQGEAGSRGEHLEGDACWSGGALRPRRGHIDSMRHGGGRR